MRKHNENWKRAYNKLAEEFFELQHEFDEYRKNAVSGIITVTEDERLRLNQSAWDGCACRSSSTCGTTFTVDKSGVIDRPNLSEGRYTVLIKKETNTL